MKNGIEIKKTNQMLKVGDKVYYTPFSILKNENFAATIVSIYEADLSVPRYDIQNEDGTIIHVDGRDLQSI